MDQDPRDHAQLAKEWRDDIKFFKEKCFKSLPVATTQQDD